MMFSDNVSRWRLREVNRFEIRFGVSEGSLGDPSPMVYQDEVVGVIHLGHPSDK